MFSVVMLCNQSFGKKNVSTMSLFFFTTHFRFAQDIRSDACQINSLLEYFFQTQCVVVLHQIFKCHLHCFLPVEPKSLMSLRMAYLQPTNGVTLQLTVQAFFCPTTEFSLSFPALNTNGYSKARNTRTSP